MGVGALAFAAVLAPSDVSACGAFFRELKTVTVPSLQVEQVLVIHDPAKEQEHLVRELVFRDAKEPFGFVVPTPSLPTVAKVEHSPFEELAKTYDPDPPGIPPVDLSGAARSNGGGIGGGATVMVLSEQRIGSFTAFVLSATDSAALKSWLSKNQLTTTPSSDAWLQHYVTLGFYFVAFRYEVSAVKNADAKTKSETVRISFTSPLPFYPYLEPDHPAAFANVAASNPPPRELAVWLVTPERFVPVAAKTVAGVVDWRRPWIESAKHPPVKVQDLRTQLGAELGALLPDSNGAWTVQAFQDQKTSRKGWGDVVLVPEKAREVDVTKLAHFGGLAASLDAKAEKP